MRSAVLCWLAVLLILACTACAPGEALGQRRLSGDVCVTELTFSDVGARTEFLKANARVIVDRFNPPGTLYIVSHTSSSHLTIALPRSDCAGASLGPLAMRGESPLVSRQVRDFSEIEHQLNLSLPRVRPDAVDERSCIVIARAPSNSRFGLIVNELAFGGVRGMQAEQIEADVFIGSADDCELTLAFVVAAAEEMHVEEANARICEGRTFQDCGLRY